MRSTTLDRVGIPTITQAFTNAYTGYFYPMTFTDAATELYLHAHDIARDASPIWFDGERPVGIGALGVRGRRGWVGAFGIAPEYRGKGLAQAMFGEVIRLARRTAVTQMQLEVLDRNTRAIDVYSRAGFAEHRKLFSLESPSIAPSANARTLELSAALTMRVDDEPKPCWQREIQTIEKRMQQLGAFSCAGSFAIFRGGGGEASIWRAQLAQNGVGEVLGAISHQTGAQSIGITNEPEGSRLLRGLYDRAWIPTMIQHEMHLQL